SRSLSGCRRENAAAAAARVLEAPDLEDVLADAAFAEASRLVASSRLRSDSKNGRRGWSGAICWSAATSVRAVLKLSCWKATSVSATSLTTSGGKCGLRVADALVARATGSSLVLKILNDSARPPRTRITPAPTR